jgi:2,3-bisphosphoglycerate-dependent phosphoglycerate mutase
VSALPAPRLPVRLPSGLPLRFVRHGATAPNLVGLRCGGDLDVPLTELGRQQADAVGVQLVQLQPPVGLIVTSDLQRTRETATLIARHLPGVPVVVEPGFAERRLGAWNLMAVSLTQPWLEARMTPPGGESDDEFTDRIAGALRRIKSQLHQHPLLVGSKGVARVMGELMGLPQRLELDNAVLAEFDFAQHPCLQTEWGAL